MPVVAVVLFAAASAGAARTATTATATATAAGAAPVSLVPIGGFRERDADALAGYFRKSLVLQASVLPGASLPRTAFSRVRGSTWPSG